MQNYDTFARFYDQIMGDRSDVVSIITTQLRLNHPSATSLFELGCGTGEILLGLSPYYDVSGIELSSEMLKIAQHKLPSSRLYVGDIRNFKYKASYDVIVCVFDTINHIEDYSSWVKIFIEASKNLNDNGILLFDMITIDRIHALMAMPTYTLSEGNVTAEMEITRTDADQVEWTTTIQEVQSDGMIQVYEDHAIETAFPYSKVHSTLSEHFDVLSTFDSNMKNPSDLSDRIYFIARKK